MNWLAHLLLSEPSSAFRLGNLLPDLVRIGDLQGLSGEFQRGIMCHRRIDAFTDSHAIVRCSRSRVGQRFRRFSGIMVDVFYDHFLSLDWPLYSPVSLRQLTLEVYESIDTHRAQIPAMALYRLERLREGDVLCSYESVAGVRMALERIGAHLRRPVHLGASVGELETHYEALHADFSEFFPELAAHVGFILC